ncbi:MAG: TonB-dependent receptor [Burkholderiaceae bacterium]|jgi:vitamin B12 transporter|nr:TonB-dependent receptor [Burkholderiaceae bacterium]
MHRPQASLARRTSAASVAALSIVYLSIALAGPGRAQAQAAPSAAASPAAQLPPVVITGARVEQRLDEALAPVTIITREDIERLQATELTELIGRQPGLQFVRSGGPGAQSSVFARGAGSSQLLVLVDGMRLNTVTGGFATLGGIALDSVDRIEIVRGNLSSLYGSEAIGGVVQIFTRGGNAPRELVVSAEAGSGATLGGSVSATQSFAQTRVSATAAARRSEPFSALDPARVQSGPFTPGVNGDDDGNRQRSGTLRITQGLGESTSLGLTAWTQRNKTDFDSSADGPAAVQQEDARTEVWRASLRQALGDTWTLRAFFGEAREESENRSSVATSFNNGRFEARNRDAQVTLQAQLAERVTAQAGLEYLDQRGGSTGYDPAFGNRFTDFGRRATSGWIGVTGRTLDAGRQQVQLNVRHDDYSDVGDADTWLAAYGYALTPRLRVTLQGSTAFRAPSFNDLYFPFFGNSGLRPEKASSEELGLRYAHGGARASLSLFRTRTRDLVQFNAITSQAENIARARARGVELSAAVTAGPWQVEGNGTWLSTEDEATGQRLVRRAPRTFNLGVFREQGAWRLGGEASWVAARDDFDVNSFQRKSLPSYTLLRAVAQWRASKQLSVTLRAENLLDEQYTLVDGYNTWGRAVFAGLQWRM